MAGDDNDQDNKTEQPTGKKLSDAHEQGQVILSREINQLFTLTAIFIVLTLLLPMLVRAMRDQLIVLIERPDQIVLGDGGIQKLVLGIILGIGGPLIGIAAVCMGASIISQILQTGLNVVPTRLIPNLANFSLTRGLSRVFSLNGLFEFLKNIIKFSIIGGAAAAVFWPTVKRLQLYTGFEPAAQVQEMYRIIHHILLTIIFTVIVLALFDYVYQYFRFMRSMRMSREEVKDEHRQSEGDPVVKGRLRRMRFERSRKRMMAKVPEADVVITNPTHFAVALKYDSKKSAAPIVIAKGQDYTALRIREIATANKVVIVENPPLARALYASVEIDQEISPEHYRAVAEVISYVFKLQGKLKQPAAKPAAPPKPSAKIAGKTAAKPPSPAQK